MIKRFVKGNPIKTYSVIKEIKTTETNEFIEKYYNLEKNQFVIDIDENSYIYGLGGSNRGINKKGYIYRSFCTDDPVHTEDKISLYAAQNFFVLKSNKNLFGVYIDTPSPVKYDIGFTDIDKFYIDIESNDYEIYYITSDTILNIVKEFREIIGQSYIAPRWALGYGQSRWGYMNEEDIIEVYENYKKHNIPIDSIYLDIDYMEKYKDFTIDKTRFNDLKNLTKKMREKNIHLVPIIDAGVKIEKGYEIYDEGIKNNFFCVDENNNPFIGAVWPGQVHFPDFLNKDARSWFGKKYKILLDLGIDGFWNDMNEPAIFYSKSGLEKMYNKIESNNKNLNVSIYDLWDMKNSFMDMSNSVDDYSSFYHNYDGCKINHIKVHNLYGFNMTKSAMEEINKLTDKRTLLFSRSSFIGMHRYGGIWTGDNSSWWSHLLMAIQMMPGLNMCGFIYSGSDIGGFGSNTSEDLMTRWLQFAIFTPLMRNHSALGTRRQELYEFKNIEVLKNIVEIRYRLLPYIYSEYMKAILKNEMLFKPLSFVYENDKRCYDIHDQLIIGNEIMIAPIYTQNSHGRYVYLPEKMKMIKFKNSTEFEEKILDKGDHFISLELHEFCIFILENKAIPFSNIASSTEEINYTDFNFISFNENINYDYYSDNGIEKNISLDNIKKLNLIKEDYDI